MADSMWLFSNTSNPLHFSKCGIVVVTPCGPTSKVAQVLEKWPTPSAILARNGRQLWGPLEAQSCRPFRFEMAYRVGTVSNTFALLTLCLGGPGNTTCLLHLLCYYDYGVLLDICYGN